MSSAVTLEARERLAAAATLLADAAMDHALDDETLGRHLIAVAQAAEQVAHRLRGAS